MQAAPGDKIGRKAFERQARQILRRLLASHACLRRQTNGKYGLHTARAREAAVMSLDAEFISAMCAHDFLAGTKEKLIASQAGAMWLRRISFKDDDVFRSQHQMRIKKPPSFDGETDHLCKINAAENPLLWLSRRHGSDGKKLVNEAQFQAGCRLQDDFLMSTARPRVTADLTTPLTSKNAGHKPDLALRLNERALVARQRFDQAITDLGPELAEIAVEICCHMRGLAQAERKFGWPKRTSKIVLGIALTKLARHYGIMR